jgi:sulfotransferase
MNRKYIFTAGLPRAGSTLLGTILNQNPRFQASISGPLARFVRAIIHESSAQGGYRTECPPEKRKQLLHGLFENYYDDPTKEVCVNHNRGWPLLLPTIKDLYPEAKLILCVRSIDRILNSFEWLVRKQPYTYTNMFSPDESISVYSRCESLLSRGRTLDFAYTAVKEAITGEYKSSIMILEYDQLAQQPEVMMKALYSFIEEPYFEHNFNDVEASYDEFDEDVGIKGMHTTRKVVTFDEKEMIIPPDIRERVKGMEVWR